jgi:hypothetical protein
MTTFVINVTILVRDTIVTDVPMVTMVSGLARFFCALDNQSQQRLLIEITNFKNHNYLLIVLLFGPII